MPFRFFALFLLLACLGLALTSCDNPDSIKPHQLLTAVSIDGVRYTTIPANLNLTGGRDIALNAEPIADASDLIYYWSVGKGTILNSGSRDAIWRAPGNASNTILGLTVTGTVGGTQFQQRIGIRMTF